MILPLTTALVLTAATLILTALLGVAIAPLRRRRSFWRGTLWTHAGLFALHAFVTFPLWLGWLGSRSFVGTRHNERPYAGPRLLADGTFAVQSWDTLKQERDAKTPLVPPDVVAAAAAREHRIPSSDGVTLRAFRLEAKQQPPTAVAILVHGLFRSALELEPVAAMLREQGCECWLVELRNFGGSSRATFTAGLRESDDVVAAVRHVRAQPDRASTPLVLFGVSFGTVAISLALPRIDHVAAVALDAPIDDMGEAASRLLTLIAERRPGWAIAPPWQALVLRSLELWSGIELAAIRPADVLATLPPDIPVLVVGAGIDDRAPPDSVERLFARLPMHDANKRLWMVPASHHGRVFLDDPAGYAEHLRWLLARLRPATTAR
jgi:uncharacterized protein